MQDGEVAGGRSGAHARFRPPLARRVAAGSLSPSHVGLVAAAAAAGVALRAWILASPLGTLDADEAVGGLMARHVLDGEFSTFFWGQSHGGTLEAILTAGVFAVTGSSVLALKLVAIALFALAAVLVWRIGRRTIGEPGATVAAALFWIWPAYVVWKSTRALSFYASGLLLGLAILLIALRLYERESRRDAVLLGLAAGAGVWATPQVAFLAVPAIAWLVWRRPRALRSAPLVLPAAAVAAAPWIVWNLRHDWYSFKPGPEPGDDTYVDHLVGLVAANLPTFLAVRVPYSLDWPAGEVVGRLVTAAALAGFAWVLLRARRHPLECIVAIGALYPFLYALSPFSSYIDEPRYLFLLAPVPALLIGRALAARPWGPPVGVAVALLLSVAMLAAMRAEGITGARVDGRYLPADLGPALDVLEAEGSRTVLADYWIAYRISFESAERIIATSTGVVRYAPHDLLVRAAPSPARVYVAGDRLEQRDRRRLEAAGLRRVEAGEWAVYVPAT